MKINGVAVPGWVEWDVDNNGHFAADTWRVTYAAQALPATNSAAWFCSQSDIVVEILAGLVADPTKVDPASFTSLIIGRADELIYDPVRGLIELAGRDYSAKLLDNRIGEVYKNQTVAQVVAMIAARRGLTAQVTGGGQILATFYEIDKARLSGDRTEWDVICWLAQEMQSTVWVSGTVIYFAPLPSPSTVTPYPIAWTPPTPKATRSAPVVDLKCERALTLARDVQVTVQSWHKGQKKAFKATSTAAHTATGKGSRAFASKPQTYIFNIAGLDQAGCQAKAQALRAQISRNEMKLTATLPGDLTLSAHGIVQVTGTGTQFDQIYYPISVKRSMSMGEGFRMNLTATSVAVQSTAT